MRELVCGRCDRLQRTAAESDHLHRFAVFNFRTSRKMSPSSARRMSNTMSVRCPGEDSDFERKWLIAAPFAAGELVQLPGTLPIQGGTACRGYPFTRDPLLWEQGDDRSKHDQNIKQSKQLASDNCRHVLVCGLTCGLSDGMQWCATNKPPIGMSCPKRLPTAITLLSLSFPHTLRNRYSNSPRRLWRGSLRKY